MPDVSIIIVSYNTRAYLENCLASVIKHTAGLSYEILVSDNGSTDGSQEAVRRDFPSVTLIENGQNLGFGAANNRALDRARGKYVFYLNSDTVLLNNAVKMFFEYWEAAGEGERLGALGCNLLDENREVTISSGPLFSFWGDFKMYIKTFLRLLSFGLRFTRNAASPREKPAKHFGDTGIILGADLFMRNDEYARFDEAFFLYHEEADLQFQLAKLGKRRVLIDGPEIIHFGGKSDPKTADRYGAFCSFARMHDYLSRLKFYRKNYGGGLKLLLLKLVILAILAFPPLLSRTKPWLPKVLAV